MLQPSLFFLRGGFRTARRRDGVRARRDPPKMFCFKACNWLKLLSVMIPAMIIDDVINAVRIQGQTECTAFHSFFSLLLLKHSHAFVHLYLFDIIELRT